MIGVAFPYPARATGQLVLAALRRSVSASQAAALSRGALASVSTLVAVDMPDAWTDDLIAWLARGRRKLILFGRISDVLAHHLGWQPSALPDALERASRSEPAPRSGMAASRAAVRYGAAAAALGLPAWHRPFERFDFADEWNNLGYGAIRADGSCWSIAVGMDTGADELAAIEIDGRRQGSYAALARRDDASVLWFNRAAGPCDSWEWRIVEQFLSAHGAETLPCHPVLSEVPWGHDAAITSRLDCDEDVESARPLWDAYREAGVPFSLAVHTSTLADERQHGLLRELIADGGAVLSHTATHAPQWGGSYEAALHEGWASAHRLHAVTGREVRYAVSPFHQTPRYALHALADLGYAGCIGGIIRNDPEFVLARGGELAGLPAGFVGHSQQCMLHGDCLLAEGDPLAVYREAFDRAHATGTLFGYLDHPFSARYAYGWADEAARIDAHRQLIAHIRARAQSPLFLHEEAAMDFLQYRAQASVREEEGAYRVAVPVGASNGLQLAIEYHGRRMCATGWEASR
ncbi:polysaccharide deacetylase family protein [Cupriavidus gilardii]|uniref:polysaccharide deacetylase family protein n=1 Tax=Cupriavidus gilardii TaxID=82541 RepID=UPI001FD0A12D|nr:polysaccharide deacetylase family protein [Cupriavidus gilardii]MCT9070992.1 polysaccharide deacetylase family protein [Cupriavidus gilardii]